MTKDEFVDIMSGIDERLIDSTLAGSQPEIVDVQYKRPPVLRYIMGIAACIALLVTTVIAVPYLKSILPQLNDRSESAYSLSSDKPDFIRGWDPGKLADNEFSDYLYIGANARICTAELDGITAELILHNVKKMPGEKLVNELTDFDYANYIGAENIVLYIYDDKGRRFIATSVTPHSYNGMELINTSCLSDGCTRLYKAENKYVLMQYADYNNEQNALIAEFYNVDLERRTFRDENGIFDASDWRAEVAGERRIGGWGYGYQASNEFEYVGGAKFSDPVYGYEMFWNGYAKVVYKDDMPENYESTICDITGWNTETYAWNYVDVTTGEKVGCPEDSADCITVSLIMHNIIKLPGERHYIYCDDEYLDMWAAEDICLYIVDTEGNRILLRVPTRLFDGAVKFFPNVCLYENCIRLLKIEQDGTDRYVIRMFLDEEDGVPIVSYIYCDIEDYISNSPKNEYGIYICDELRFVEPAVSEKIDDLVIADT